MQYKRIIEYQTTREMTYNEILVRVEIRSDESLTSVVFCCDGVV